MNKYEIHIGEVIEHPSGEKRPKQIMEITDEQRQIVEAFADTRKDENLNTIYKINQCEFTIHIDFSSMGESKKP